MRVKYGAVVAIVVLSFGCNDNGLRAGTYNLGLAPGFVPFTDERAPLTIQALADQPLDVACVQEVWRESDVTALQNATASKLPYSNFPAPNPGTTTGTEPACEGSALDSLQGCVATSCAGLATDALAGCVIASCETELGSLPTTCSQCLAANIGASFDQIRIACTTTPGGEFAFGGSYGIGLLSRYPLLDLSFLPLAATYNRRGVIYARIEVPNVGTVHTFCTHLTPIFADIPYPGAGSWESEQRAQIQALLDWIATKATPEDQVVVMGDFNTGPQLAPPSGPPIAGEAPDNYTLLLSSVFDPYVAETPTPECTFCASNPLVPDTSPSTLIDHVLVRNLKAHDSSMRFLTGDLQIDGTTIAYSDHYGMSSTLRD